MTYFCPEEEPADILKWIRDCLDGDTSAYQGLVRAYEARVARWMSRFSRDTIVIGELVQEVFVEAWFSLGKYRAKGPFGAWLRVIAIRTGYRYWRQQDVRRGREAELPETAWKMLHAPETAPISDAADTVYQFLEYLDPKDRLVLTLAYWDGHDAREIAAITGWSYTLTRVRLHRSRERLRKLLAAGPPAGGHGGLEYG